MSSAHATADPTAAELRATTIASARAIFAARVVAELLLLGSTLVLARLLSPAQFGHAVVALILTAVASTVVAGVAAQLLIQRAELTQPHLEAASALGLLLGGTLTVAGVALAPLTAGVFSEETASLMQVSAVGFLLVGVAVAPQALLQRRLAFRRLSVIEVASSVAGTAVSLALAIAGAGGEALVVGILAGLAISSVGAMISTPLVRPRWHPAEVRELVGFGGLAALSSLAAITYSNVDYAILAGRLDARSVGLYWRAYQLGAEYQGKISVVMLRLAFPVFSRSADREQLRRMRRRIMRVHATVIFPLLAVLIAVAPELVPFLYGETWRPAVVPTQILASVGMMAAVLSGIGQLMYALGDLRRMALLSWISVVVYGVTIWFVAPHGVIAVCVADAVLYLALLLASHYFLASRQAGIPMSSLVEEAGPALLASVAALAAAGPATELLADAGWPPPATIAVSAVLGIGLYALVLRRVSPAAWRDVRLLVSRRSAA